METMSHSAAGVVVSLVIPAHNEAELLPRLLGTVELAAGWRRMTRCGKLERLEAGSWFRAPGSGPMISVTASRVSG